MTTVEPIVLSELKHKHEYPIITRLDIDGTLYELHDAHLDAEIENIEQAIVNTQEAINSVSDDLNTINNNISALDTAISDKVDKISYTTPDIGDYSIVSSVSLDLTKDDDQINLITRELTAKNVLASNLTEYSKDNEYALNEDDISYLASYGTENEKLPNKTYLTHDVLVYLLKKVNTMSGVDPELLASLEKIIAELEGDESGAAGVWITLVDKLKGLGDETVTQYVERITSNLWVKFPNMSYATIHNYDLTYNEETTTLSINKNDVGVYEATTGDIPESQVYSK